MTYVPWQHHCGKILLVLLLTITTLTSCGRQARVITPPVTTPPAPAQPVVTPSPPHSPGVQPKVKGPAHSLWQQAESAMHQGNPAQAEMLMERALRIEPANGWYWFTMGQVQLAQGAPQKARQFWLKAKSQAGKNQALRQQVERALRELQNY
jgi:tetratricopeptide (TPR) repeat protein